MNWRLPGLSLLLLMVLWGCTPHPEAVTPPAPTDTLPPDPYQLAETLARAGRPSLDRTGIDRTTFPYPVQAGVCSVQGYPIYLIHCNDLTGICTDDLGHLLGSMDVIMAHLTPVRNTDAQVLSCRPICTDSYGHIVGVPTPAMRAYLAAHPAATTSKP